jgi:hypothetical protein
MAPDQSSNQQHRVCVVVDTRSVFPDRVGRRRYRRVLYQWQNPPNIRQYALVAAPLYPFEPKSNSYLRPGQFWGVPLSDGRWACGRVLAVKKEPDDHFPGNSRTFLAALMDWGGNLPPTADDLEGRNIVAQGWAHVLTIQKNGQRILGHRDLALEGITGLLEVTHRAGGTVMLYQGATPVRPATREEAATLPVLSTWGFKVISVLAERLFVKRLPLAPPRP